LTESFGWLSRLQPEFADKPAERTIFAVKFYWSIN